MSQLELPIVRPLEPDRNHELGGRSFYFFDFDDNVAFLTSKIYIFHKDTNKEVALTTGAYAKNSRHIGKSGLYKDYQVNFDDETGSFRRFRDYANSKNKTGQPFIEDLLEALQVEDLRWKGPSWNCFFHASHNQRPISVITARGHQEETIKEGIRLLVAKGFIPKEPNYLSVYPVSNPGVRDRLGDKEKNWSVALLKQKAIRDSVLNAIKVYGYSPHHRFGMSDDDPHNVELIIEEMISLKKDYPEMSFFVIDTHGDQALKKEVFLNYIKTEAMDQVSQLSLFDKE